MSYKVRISVKVQQWSNYNNDDPTEAAVMKMISAMTKNRIGVLVLEWHNRSRVMVLVFVNWNLYKKNFCGGFPLQEGEVLARAESQILCVLVSLFFIAI